MVFGAGRDSGAFHRPSMRAIWSTAMASDRARLPVSDLYACAALWDANEARMSWLTPRRTKPI